MNMDNISKKRVAKKTAIFHFHQMVSLDMLVTVPGVVNQGIDTPLVCVEPNDRPMWNYSFFEYMQILRTNDAHDRFKNCKTR